MGACYLGLDSSTQSMSAMVLDLDSGQVCCETSVNFEKDLPQYGTCSGVLPHADPRVKHSSPLMWVDALLMVLDALRDQGAPMSEIRALSGSGQQHGSVYLNHSYETVLRRMAGETALDQLVGALSRPSSPIWMDSSTDLECAEIEEALGGKAATVALTGSAAFERFTGPQIRAFYKRDPIAYENTAHIALVSSFLASVLVGKIAPIDYGDGAGMNLMDIKATAWSGAALNATAPKLAAKLPPVVPSNTVVGPLAPVWVQRWGFAPDAQVVTWSGDNPSSLIGTGLIEPGQSAISLGTSDTYFGAMSEARTDPAGEGHVFGSPAGGYMSLICFKNGSLAREAIRDQYGLDWAGFAVAIRQTEPGNNGAFMLPWIEPEIVPKVLTPGLHRIHLDAHDAAANCRAVVESQAISMRLHSAWMGIRPACLYVTGGAAVDDEIVQIIADVNQCPVYRHDVLNSAAMGAAIRAAQAAVDGAEWSELINTFAPPPKEAVAQPRPEYAGCYAKLEAAYQQAEQNFLS